MRSVPAQLCCHDCRSFADDYIVRDDVWLEAWPTYEADKKAAKRRHLLLCFRCLEARLGRYLRLDDFVWPGDGAIVNRPIFFGAQIGREQDLEDGLLRAPRVRYD